MLYSSKYAIQNVKASYKPWEDVAHEKLNFGRGAQGVGPGFKKSSICHVCNHFVGNFDFCKNQSNRNQCSQKSTPGVLTTHLTQRSAQTVGFHLKTWPEGLSTIIITISTSSRYQIHALTRALSI